MPAEVFRKHPIVIAWNFIALQFTAIAVYLSAASLLYFAQIWRGLPILAQYLSFEIAEVAFIFLAESMLISFIFVLWYRDAVYVFSDRVTHAYGIFRRRHTTISLVDNVATHTQSFLGRLIHYGTVAIQNNEGTVVLKLLHMPEPAQVVDRMMGRSAPAIIDPHTLMRLPEYEKLERKSTFRWDLQRHAVNRALEKATMKTIAAFLNTAGGHVVLGADDRGGAVGMTHDWATLPRKDADGFENHFSHVLSTMIGPTFRRYVQLEQFEYDGKPCVSIAVAPAHNPAYVREDDREEFFIRTGNSTTSLKMSDAAEYINSRFRSR